MSRIHIVFLLVMGVGIFSCTPERAVDVEWVSTTEGAAWVQYPVDSLFESTTETIADFTIFPDRPMQTIEGFGACFNELGWTALELLPERDRDSVMSELFTSSGAHFTYCRMPVAANDFATDWYSYDETVGDFSLHDFSIAHDQQTLIPFIHKALKYQPDLKLWASPWSPPQWMKYNQHYALNHVPDMIQGVENGIADDQLGKEGTDMFIQQPEYFDAYARYFERFIQAYREEGIHISMVMPQNEFNSAQWYPSCTWTPEGLRKFIEVLAPRMNQIGVKTFFGTLERADAELFSAVYDSAEAHQEIAGVGLQWAGKGAIAAIHTSYPELPLYQTEHECGNGENSWAYTVYGWDLIKHYLMNGASAYFYWNMVLKEGGISRWGWKQNSLVTVNEENSTISWTNDYYLMKHLSHYVQPGAVLLKTSSEQTINHRNDVLGWWEGDLTDNAGNLLAFQNPDHSIAIVIYNAEDSEKAVKLNVNNIALTPVLESHSFNTFLISPTGLNEK